MSQTYDPNKHQPRPFTWCWERRPRCASTWHVQIFGTCGALDVMLARKAMPAHVPVSGASSRVGRGHVTFNPKAMCCGVMEPIARAMPHARHMLMYRDALKVSRGESW